MKERVRVNTVSDHGCFGCGERNPIGLKLAFFREGEAVEAEFIPCPHHEGYVGMVHGGIIGALLDEAMSWAVIAGGRLAVTAQMTLRFRRPVRVGEPVRVRGEVADDGGRTVQARAVLLDSDGAVLAEASGTYVRVDEAQQRAWEERYLGR
jgi:uncharacterized protein (TIGR00369 family)